MRINDLPTAQLCDYLEKLEAQVGLGTAQTQAQCRVHIGAVRYALRERKEECSTHTTEDRAVTATGHMTTASMFE